MKKLAVILFIVIFAPVAFGQTKTEMKVSDLSKPITDWVAKNLKAAKIERAFKVTDKGVTTYDLLIANGADKSVFIFDKDGKFVKRAERGSKGGTQPVPATSTQAQPGTPATPPQPKK
jgi:hypothetical protein